MVRQLKFISDTSSLAFEPDILAPQQFITSYRRRVPVEPEKALMFAVLAEAVDTYQRFAFSPSSRGRALFCEAQAWFWDEDEDCPFSFRSICGVFSLDATFLRRGLMQWTAKRRHASAPRKRIRIRLDRSRNHKLSALTPFRNTTQGDQVTLRQ
jgi:hypothetical protein